MLPKTTSAQRAKFYRDVDDLISPGFLSHNVKVGQTRFALRTLGPGDLFLLRHRTGDDLDDWRVWALASSIWMVNGHNILPEEGLTARLFEMLQRMPARAVDILFSTFAGLVARSRRADDTIEPYMYELSSRSRWRALGGNTDGLRIGVPGSEQIGHNIIQQIWVSFNEGEDNRLQFDNQWEGFKLVASSNSPKAVQKIDERDGRLRREEEERRQSIMDRYFHYRMGVVDREGLAQGQDRDLVSSQTGGPKTVEQLEVEMKRWVVGEQDEHDQVVEGYKQRILDRQEEVETERNERRRTLAAESKRRTHQGFEPTPMIGYTQEQLAGILAERDGGAPAGARFVYDDQFEETKQRVQKHVHKAAPGNLAVQGDRIVDPDANPGADKRTLQEMITDRSVGYSDEQPQSPAPQRPLGERPSHISESDWEEFGGQMNPAAFGGQGREE